jgi:hypothetical protein
MSRTYSDPSYNVEQTLSFPATGSLAGTAAISEKARHTFMEAVTVTDFNVYFNAGGTSTAQSFVIGKSAAGTGTFAGLGTIVVGTQATDSVKDGTVTATNFSAGDDIVLHAGGTSAIVSDGIVRVQYKERYVQSDN